MEKTQTIEYLNRQCRVPKPITTVVWEEYIDSNPFLRYYNDNSNTYNDLRRYIWPQPADQQADNNDGVVISEIQRQIVLSLIFHCSMLYMDKTQTIEFLFMQVLVPRNITRLVWESCQDTNPFVRHHNENATMYNNLRSFIWPQPTEEDHVDQEQTDNNNVDQEQTDNDNADQVQTDNDNGNVNGS